MPQQQIPAQSQPQPPQQAQPRQPTTSPALARQYASLGTVLGVGGVCSGIISILMLIASTTSDESTNMNRAAFSAAVVASITGIVLGINSYDKLREAGASRAWGIVSIVCSAVVVGWIVLWLLFLIAMIALFLVKFLIDSLQK